MFAPPELVTTANDQADAKDESGTGWRKKEGWGKKVKPPSMVLDEDVNGFKTHQKRKGAGGAGGKKKGKKVSPKAKTRFTSNTWRLEQKCPARCHLGPHGAVRPTQTE